MLKAQPDAPIVAGVNSLPSVARLAALATCALGCGGGPPKQAVSNRTFYQYDLNASGHAVERPYPPLDKSAEGKAPEYIGVTVLEGSVHLSRPKGWQIRRVGIEEKRRFIEYVSPNQYVFAIYERLDDEDDAWREIQARYQEDAKTSGAKVGKRVAMATWNAQGRAFEVTRNVKGQKAPYTSRSREILLVGKNHVDLVEIVHQDDSLGENTAELLRVMETLEIL